MALFLSEGYSTSKSTQTFEEILFEGLELTHQYNTLNEAILQADYIMSGKKASLNESTYLLQEAGFIANVWEKVKEYASKAWEWIKKFWAKVKAKTIEMYNRIKERVSGDGQAVPKSLIKKLEIKIKACEYGKGRIAAVVKMKDTASATKLTQDTAAKLNAFEKELADASKLTGDQTVSPTYFDKIIKEVSDIDNVLEQASKEADNKLTEMEKKFSDSAEAANKVQAGSVDTSEKSAHIALLKGIVSSVREMVSYVGKITNAA